MEQTVSKKEFKGFSGNELKVFAIIAMLMDHLASTIWPGYHKDWWLLCHSPFRAACRTDDVVYDCRGIPVYQKF